MEPTKSRKPDSGETASRQLARESKLRLEGECPGCRTMNPLGAERCRGCSGKLLSGQSINPLEFGVWGFRDRQVFHSLLCPPLAPIKIHSDKRYVIGRGEETDITLPGELVSRTHAAIHCENRIYYLEDLNSANGTYHNGEKISKKTPLKDGDTLSIGGFQIRYQIRRGQHVSDQQVLKELQAQSTVVMLEEQSEGGQTQSMAGNIGDIYVIQMLEFLCANRLSGILGIESVEVEGVIHFDQGEIVQASASQGKRQFEGIEALPVLTELAEGIFTFKESAFTGTRRIEDRTEDLLASL